MESIEVTPAVLHVPTARLGRSVAHATIQRTSRTATYKTAQWGHLYYEYVYADGIPQQNKLYTSLLTSYGRMFSCSWAIPKQELPAKSDRASSADYQPFEPFAQPLPLPLPLPRGFWSLRPSCTCASSSSWCDS